MTPLIDLYRGESWSQVKRLIALGARRWDTTQTFSLPRQASVSEVCMRRLRPTPPPSVRRHADSVAASRDDARVWWSTLPRVATGRGGRHLWVLSESYSRVIGTDLLETFAADDLVVFGGSSEMPTHARVHSDRALRRALGGTVTSLNVRTAIQWLLLSRGTSPFSTRARDVWQDWSEQARHREDFGPPAAVRSSRARVRRNAQGAASWHLQDACTQVASRFGTRVRTGRFSMLYQKAVAR